VTSVNKKGATAGQQKVISKSIPKLYKGLVLLKKKDWIVPNPSTNLQITAGSARSDTPSHAQ